ncbi:carbohydrate-binding protein [Nonomuraea sp. NPDC050536]|uniref:carbohydrate-binding protein n=1 Tax=Nonomuraea sp. NPDC050536 TaxID=3364366 RepID=UPI0037C60809
MGRLRSHCYRPSHPRSRHRPTTRPRSAWSTTGSSSPTTRATPAPGSSTPTTSPEPRECTVSGPATSVIVRYANGTSANRSVRYGTTIVDFPGTGSWNTWKTATFPVSLAAGMHTIRLTATTAGGAPNIDKLTLDNSTAGSGDVINVATAQQLRTALAGARPAQTIQLAGGTYHGSFIAQRAGTASAPITLRGPRDAVLINDGPGGSGPSCSAPVSGFDPGYGVWLYNASYWALTGFTVANADKGVVLDNSQHVLLDDLYIHHIDEEAVAFRRSSADGTIRNSRIEHTGLKNPQYGEGVYIGTYHSSWGCYGNSGGVDRSDRIQVIGNTIGPYVTAEHVDIKEGTQNGVIRGNTFNGTGLSGQNYADSWVDAQGNNYLIENNTGTFAKPGTFANGYETHTIITGYGCGNTWRNNTSDLGGVGGYAIYDSARCASNPNRIYSSNTVTNARKSLTNLPITP